MEDKEFQELKDYAGSLWQKILVLRIEKLKNHGTPAIAETRKVLRDTYREWKSKCRQIQDEKVRRNVEIYKAKGLI